MNSLYLAQENIHRVYVIVAGVVQEPAEKVDSIGNPKVLTKVLNVHEIFAPAHHIIFMEHIPNGELFDVLASPEPSVAGKPLAEGTSRRILRDVISGMAECYRFGVTHRDLKWQP